MRGSLERRVYPPTRIVCSILPTRRTHFSTVYPPLPPYCMHALTGFVCDRSVVGVRQVRQVNQAVRVGDARRGQVRRFRCAMATAAQQTVARALQQTARHPADQKELARAALVLALQFTIAGAARMVALFVGCVFVCATVEGWVVCGWCVWIVCVP